MPQSPVPAYIASLIRHFEDLRDGTHGGSASRKDKEAHFEKAVRLLAPIARQVLTEMNTSLRSKPEFGICFTPFGPRHAPVPLRRTTCCWPLCTGSVSRDPRRKWPSGIANRSFRHCGTSLPSVLLRKPSGTLSNRFCRKSHKISPGSKTRRKRLSSLCWACGRKNSWSVVGCWLTTPPTSIPISPAPTPAINWRNVDTTSNADTTCAKSGSAMCWTERMD
jgi:hypothetical protein